MGEMRASLLSEPRSYWAGVVHLSKDEWPPVTNAWETDGWLDRPIYRWVQDNTPASCFTVSGYVYFKHRDDMEWFRLVWSNHNNA